MSPLKLKTKGSRYFLPKKSYDSLTLDNICLRPSYEECRPRSWKPQGISSLWENEKTHLFNEVIASRGILKVQC